MEKSRQQIYVTVVTSGLTVLAKNISVIVLDSETIDESALSLKIQLFFYNICKIF